MYGWFRSNITTAAYSRIHVHAFSEIMYNYIIGRIVKRIEHAERRAMFARSISIVLVVLRSNNNKCIHNIYKKIIINIIIFIFINI